MQLSQRHGQILVLIAEGRSDKEIARVLGMSARTVGCHLQRLYQRHGVPNRAALVARWLRDQMGRADLRPL